MSRKRAKVECEFVDYLFLICRDKHNYIKFSDARHHDKNIDDLFVFAELVGPILKSVRGTKHEMVQTGVGNVGMYVTNIFLFCIPRIYVTSIFDAFSKYKLKNRDGPIFTLDGNMVSLSPNLHNVTKAKTFFASASNFLKRLRFTLLTSEEQWKTQHARLKPEHFKINHMELYLLTNIRDGLNLGTIYETIIRCNQRNKWMDERIKSLDTSHKIFSDRIGSFEERVGDIARQMAILTKQSGAADLLELVRLFLDIHQHMSVAPYNKGTKCQTLLIDPYAGCVLMPSLPKLFPLPTDPCNLAKQCTLHGIRPIVFDDETDRKHLTTNLSAVWVIVDTPQRPWNTLHSQRHKDRDAVLSQYSLQSYPTWQVDNHMLTQDTSDIETAICRLSVIMLEVLWLKQIGVMFCDEMSLVTQRITTTVGPTHHEDWLMVCTDRLEIWHAFQIACEMVAMLERGEIRSSVDRINKYASIKCAAYIQDSIIDSAIKDSSRICIGFIERLILRGLLCNLPRKHGTLLPILIGDLFNVKTNYTLWTLSDVYQSHRLIDRFGSTRVDLAWRNLLRSCTILIVETVIDRVKRDIIYVDCSAVHTCCPDRIHRLYTSILLVASEIITDDDIYRLSEQSPEKTKLDIIDAVYLYKFLVSVKGGYKVNRSCKVCTPLTWFIESHPLS